MAGATTFSAGLACTNALITAYHTVSQAISGLTPIVVKWNATQVNRGSTFTLNTSTGGISVSAAGTYQLSTSVYLATSTLMNVSVEAQVNGTAIRRAWERRLNCVLVLAASDIVQIAAYQDQTGQSYNTATNVVNTWVQLYRLG